MGNNEDMIIPKTNVSIDVSNVRNIFWMLGSICETKNENSRHHIKRMQKNTRILSYAVKENFPEYNFTNDDCELIAFAAIFHDLGKIKISDEILTKTKKLTSEEFSIIKKHPIYSIELLDSFINNEEKENNIFFKYIYEVCLYHHERYDGKGYPYQIKGDDIPISAQIVGLIDVYEALLHAHVYRGAYTKNETLDMIINGKCGVFNSKIIEAFKKSELFEI